VSYVSDLDWNFPTSELNLAASKKLQAASK
jgi:hypothetical protein